MNDASQALSGPDEVLVHLDPIQASYVRGLARAWGLTEEQVLQGLICHRLAECCEAVVDLIPTKRNPH